MPLKKIGITGLGYAVGSGVRTNDDPVFGWLKRHRVENRDLFEGYKDRAILEDGETVDEVVKSIKGAS